MKYGYCISDEEMKEEWVNLLKKVKKEVTEICDDFGQRLGNYIGTMDDIVEDFDPVLKRLNALRDSIGGVTKYKIGTEFRCACGVELYTLKSYQDEKVLLEPTDKTKKLLITEEYLEALVTVGMLTKVNQDG